MCGIYAALVDPKIRAQPANVRQAAAESGSGGFESAHAARYARQMDYLAKYGPEVEATAGMDEAELEADFDGVCAEIADPATDPQRIERLTAARDHIAHARRALVADLDAPPQ
jgi:hypothetical protein